MCDGCRALQHELNKLAEENAGLDHTVRKLGAENVALRAQNRRQAQQSPEATQIECILVNWRRLCRGRWDGDGKRGRMPVIEPDSERWAVAKKALRLLNAAQHEDPLEECLEAVEGIAAVPYVVDGQRRATGLPSQRYDDVAHALRNEVQIEKARRWRAVALRPPAALLFEVYQQCSATSEFYFQVWHGKHQREQFEGLPEYKRVAAQMRAAEKADETTHLEDGNAQVIDIRQRRVA